MITEQNLQELEQAAMKYYADSSAVSFEIEDREEELRGILAAYEGMNTASGQILRQHFLKGGGER